MEHGDLQVVGTTEICDLLAKPSHRIQTAAVLGLEGRPHPYITLAQPLAHFMTWLSDSNSAACLVRCRMRPVSRELRVGIECEGRVLDESSEYCQG
jgi:hypothetical protein